ncbi:unnamed protein product, partial [marine sediment metagenome]
MLLKMLSWLLAFVLMIHTDETGAIKIKPIEASTVKWTENAGRAAEEFAVNAEAAAEDWARNTAAAAGTFKLAITAPNISERFRRGVTRAGAAKFSV